MFVAGQRKEPTVETRGKYHARLFRRSESEVFDISSRISKISWVKVLLYSASPMMPHSSMRPMSVVRGKFLSLLISTFEYLLFSSARDPSRELHEIYTEP